MTPDETTSDVRIKDLESQLEELRKKQASLVELMGKNSTAEIKRARQGSAIDYSDMLKLEDYNGEALTGEEGEDLM